MKIQLKDWDPVGGHDAMCHFWFNTAFVDKNYLVLEKGILDKACKVRWRRLRAGGLLRDANN